MHTYSEKALSRLRGYTRFVNNPEFNASVKHYTKPCKKQSKKKGKARKKPVKKNKQVRKIKALDESDNGSVTNGV